MKKIIISSLFAVLIITACKKDRTCTCTSTPTLFTVNGQTQDLDPPTTTVTKLTKVAKDGADCNSSEETVSYTATYPGTVIAISATTKNVCKLD